MSLPPPIPLEEAQARLLDGSQPLGNEAVPTQDAIGRYLAQPLHSQRTQPPADLSAMDGYAMRADDLAGPWQVVGESAAGHPFGGVLEQGQAARISTGALMPMGAGAILLQENALREGDHLALWGDDGATPRHIRRKGFDFSKDDLLIEEGASLNPARIALALSGGHGVVSVGKKPSLAIIDSGDELASDPTNLTANQIPASNGIMLCAMTSHLASPLTRIGPVADRLDALLSAFDQARDCDVIVTSGGASVGDHDLVRPALKEWGADIDFWRIAMKPGKPLMVARRGKQVILGLPGNPVSSYVTAFLFVLPLLRRLAGAAQPLPQMLSLPLEGELRGIGSRLEFVRANMGHSSVVPLSQQDSSGLAALSASNALIRREIDSPPVCSGEMVSIYPLQNGGIA